MLVTSGWPDFAWKDLVLDQFVLGHLGIFFYTSLVNMVELHKEKYKLGYIFNNPNRG